jgi:N-acetylneuraminic acid mutarotase
VTSKIDTEDRVGLLSTLLDEKTPVLQTSQQYGIYGTALLKYHAKHVRGMTAGEINAAGSSRDLKFEIVPKIEKGQLVFEVRWNDKPLAGADVTIFAGDKESLEEKTDHDGQVTFIPKRGGLIGVLASTMEDKSGELDAKPYKGVLHYASLTFRPPDEIGNPKQVPTQPKKGEASVPKMEVSEFPSLPEPLASFGGVVSEGWLYVYGGHIGEEHEHSVANLSKHFRRIQLESGKVWQELPMQTPLQGLPLVAHRGKVYRVGGLDIRNSTAKETEDLHSSAEFAEYNPISNKWTALTPLPAGRSSHNAVVIGDRLYVVGGWRLEGKPPGSWEPDALFYDFAKPELGWQKLPRPDFKRRALAVGHRKDRLYAMGGMDEKGNVSMDVFVFDPVSEKWSNGPSLPGAGLAGFGVSAWNLDGSLYECGFRGVLYRLNKAGSGWEEAGHIKTPRFFHQLVSTPAGGLLVVGGASAKGQVASIEPVEIDKSTNKQP